MKRYIGINTDVEKVKQIIIDMINDNELWAGGIPKIDIKLQEIGFSQKECNSIVWHLFEVINRLSKRLH